MMRHPATKRHWALALLIALVALLFGALKMGAQGESYELSWFTLDCGGATFTETGDFQLGGTIGQPDGGIVAGGVYTMTGGFWAITSPGAQAIFGDGFETGDVSVWSRVTGVVN